MLDTILKSTLFFTLFFSVLIGVSGCGTIQDIGERAIIEGAKANDSALEASETIICRGASVGAIMRKYGQSPAKAAAWRTLCVDKNEAKILTE